MDNKKINLLKQKEIIELAIKKLKVEKANLLRFKTYNEEDKIRYDETKKEIKKAQIIDKVLFVAIATTFFLIFNGLNLILGALAVLTTTGFLVNNNYKLLRFKKIIRDLNKEEIDGVKNSIEEDIKRNAKKLLIEETKLTSIINIIQELETVINKETNTTVDEKEEELEKPKVKELKKYN